MHCLWRYIFHVLTTSDGSNNIVKRHFDLMQLNFAVFLGKQTQQIMSLSSKAYCSSVFTLVIDTMNFCVKVALEELAIESYLQYRLGNDISMAPCENELEVCITRACNVFYMRGSKIVQKLA